MDLAHPSTLLLPAGIAAFLAWRIYSRTRRLVGRQRLSPVRPWLTIVVFPLLIALLLLGSYRHGGAAWGLAGGVAVGLGLGWYGLRLTRFEQLPEGLYFTPNAHLGMALSLLLIGRIAYRAVQIYSASGSFQSDSGAFVRSPLTLLIFGTLAGYYVAYAVGLLAWKHRVGLVGAGPAGEQQTPGEAR